MKMYLLKSNKFAIQNTTGKKIAQWDLVGTQWELVGTRWELSGNSLGMWWDYIRNVYGACTELIRSWYGVDMELVWSWYGVSNELKRSLMDQLSHYFNYSTVCHFFVVASEL
jgi:hypothetical protein